MDKGFGPKLGASRKPKSKKGKDKITMKNIPIANNTARKSHKDYTMINCDNQDTWTTETEISVLSPPMVEDIIEGFAFASFFTQADMEVCFFKL